MRSALLNRLRLRLIKQQSDAFNERRSAAGAVISTHAVGPPVFPPAATPVLFVASEGGFTRFALDDLGAFKESSEESRSRREVKEFERNKIVPMTRLMREPSYQTQHDE